MANEFIIRKGYKSLSSSEITGSLIVSSDTTVIGSVKSNNIVGRSYPTYNILSLEDDNLPNQNGVSLSSVGSMAFHLDVNNNSANDSFDWKADASPSGTATSLMRLTDEGNLGIGTTSPVAKLEINGGTGVATAGAFILRQTGNSAADGMSITSGHTTSTRIYKDSNGVFKFGPSSNPDAFQQALNGNITIEGIIDSNDSTIDDWGSVSASLSTLTTDLDVLENKNLISGSAQVDHDQTTNFVAGEHFLQSAITTVGTVTSGNVTAILPANTVSSSAQIASDISGSITSFSASVSTRFEGLTTDYTELDNIPNNIVSSSAQIASDISGSITSFSGSIAGRVKTNESSISSLTGATGSYLRNTTDTLTGNLTVTGTLTAQEFNTEFVSASIIYDSGSTKFGDTLDDNHDFTGSVNVSGSIIVDDNSKLQLGGGASGDMRLYHNGIKSLIVNNTGNLEITQFVDDGDIIFKSDDGSGGTTEYFRLDGGDARMYASREIRFVNGVASKYGDSGDLGIYHDGTNSFIENITGDLTILNNTDDGDILFKSDNGSGGLSTYLKIDGGSTNVQFAKDVFLYDNVKLNIGGSFDLRLFHDTSNSYIQAQGTGNLIIQQTIDDKDIVFKSDDGSGGVTEYFRLDGGSTKTIYSKGLQILDNIVLSLGSSDDLQISHNTADTWFDNYTGNINFRNRQDDGDIIFYSDDGSGGHAEYFRIDGGNRSIVVSAALGMYFNDGVAGRFGDDGDMHLYHDGSNSVINNTTGHLQLYNNADDGDIQFISDDGSGGTAEYFRVDGGIHQTVFSKSTRHTDSVKAEFGSGQDLRIYHDGSNSYIDTSTTSAGDLYIKSQGTNHDLYLQSSDDIFIRPQGGEMGIKVQGNDNVELYFNNVRKLRTTNTGAIIEGDLDADDITIDDWGSVSASLASIATAGGVNGSGQAGKITKWTAANTLGNSIMTEGTNTVQILSDGAGAAGAILELKHANNNLTDVCGTINLTNNAGGYAAIEGGTTGANNSGYIAFKTDNAGTQGERMRIINNGNIGIATSTPSETLHIGAGHLLFERGVELRSKDTGGTQRTLARVNSSNQLEFGWSGNGPVKFMGGGSYTERMRIHTNGNVGIGYDAPYDLLHVHNSTNSGTPDAQMNFTTGVTGAVDGNGFRVGWNGSVANLYLFENADMRFATNNNEKMRIAASGYVGIGTTSPGTLLDIAGSGEEWLRIVGGATDISGIRLGSSSGSRQNVLYRNRNNDLLTIRAGIDDSDIQIIAGGSANEIMRFDGTNSRVGIGTTTPAYKLDVTGDSTSGVIAVRNSANGRDTFRSENAGGTRTVNIGNDANGHGLVLVRGSGGTTTNYIAGNGNSYFNAGNVGIGATSPDQKLQVIGDGTGNSGIGFKQSGAQEHRLYAANQIQNNAIGSSAPVWKWGQSDATGSISSQKMLLNNSGLTVTGDIDADDVTIDGWGSVSASLSSISEADTLQTVTTRGASTTNAITINKSSESTYFTGGSGGLRQLSITSGTNTSAHALHTFNIASSNGKYEFDVNGTTEFSLDSTTATLAGQITTTQNQITTNIATTSAIRLKPGSTTNTTGKSSIFLGTSPVDNYGISLRGARLGSDGTPTFELATHFNSANGTVALSINNSQNATFAGDVNVEDNLYLTDAGTVRGKIQLNSSDRDNLDIKAISLGSLMRFYTVDTLALTLDASQNASFAAKVQADSWFQGASSTNTLWSSTSTGVYLQTPGSTADDNDSKIYFRNHGTTVKHTFDTNNGDATFAGKVSVGGGDTTTAQVALKGQQGLLSFVRGTSGDAQFFMSSDSARLYFSHTDIQSNNLILQLDSSDSSATFKGNVSIQADDADFLVRSNDYTISRIISRGSSGTNLDKGLFSLMTSDGTNNNIEAVRIDSAGGSWFNGGATTFGSDVTLTDGVLTVNDGNNYVKISEGSNSIGQIELKDSNPVFVQGWGSDFKVAVGTYDNTALTINSAKNATFANNVTINGTLTAQQFHTEFVSSSILHESGSTSFGNSSDDVHNFTGSLNVQGNISHSGVTLTSGTDIDQVKEVAMTLQLTADTWTDTGIDGADLATGTYAVQVYVDDHNVNGKHFDEYYSGMMSWFSTGTNSTMVDEIPLHRAGHAPNEGDIQLRTQRASGTDTHDLMLQIKHTQTYSGALDNSSDGKIMRFKFRRLI